MKRALFKALSAVHVFLYRLTGGVLGSEIGQFRILLLTTTGRKSRKRRTTPLGYFEHDGAYVIIASNGGSDNHPGWLYNLKHDPPVEIQVKDRKIAARAEEAGEEARQHLWARLIEVSPAYEQYRKRTTRTIPLVILRSLN